MNIPVRLGLHFLIDDEKKQKDTKTSTGNNNFYRK